MDDFTIGVVASSRKEHERRLPLHPRHLGEIDPDLRSRILLEERYGAPFEVSDEQLAAQVGGLLPRGRLLEEVDAVILPKPVPEDVAAMREGQILCGWVHLVQDPTLTQLAIERRLTVIPWEARRGAAVVAKSL